MAVAPAAHGQAVSLQQRLPYPLFLDEQQKLRDFFELRRPGLFEWITDSRAWWRYLRALLRNRRQYRITGHFSNVPAVAIVDRDGSIAYLHRGTGIGDYPPVADIVGRL